MDAVAERILADPRFQEIDRHFARLVDGLDPAAGPELAAAAALVSRARAEGHICLDLELAADESAAAWPETAAWGGGGAWARRLAACRPVGGAGEWAPLVLEGRRLYLYRYWRYEQTLAERLLALAADPAADSADPELGARLGRFFPSAATVPDWQRVAAYVAATRRLCVISGGPGTGKTATAARILALLLEQRPERIVALAAPTGKAAARMNEALRSVLAGLDVAAAVKERALARPAQTIHRLLGARGSGAFARGATDPVPCDVLVVDEASMVDVALMARLLEALPGGARLVLLGDKNQLASVEAGAFLGDLCAAPAENRFRPALAHSYAAATGDRVLAEGHADPAARPLQDCLVQLRHSYRFAADGGIGALCHAVNAGASWSAFEPLFATHAEIRWLPLPPPRELAAALAAAIEDGFAPCAAVADPLAALEALRRFRILCAVRDGPYGTTALNCLAENVLAARGVIRPPGGAWYAHRPVMVTVNDYNLRLFNGDIGLVRPDADGALRVFFPPEGEGPPRRFLPAMLPAHETVYAMTVHKSQGSEFDRVLLVLPDRENPVLTRELVYTAVTRARQAVDILAAPAVFASAAAARVRRTSGLRERLWGMVNSKQ
ncbi:MAG TPA: exodeoxyribonuclease V subunit alpha [Acidobacteriota bacterium]|nr:exodeoxyribonuclease V subunit alpha [Acidobacteriota bacterium]HQF87848.1 exodeoxyribonuclease V subunit alpha [Acidobacteriota bacterium]HQG92564.1 exodeoxyribonuclease V subunit alpha [Acidobacteriota bacterium]